MKGPPELRCFLQHLLHGDDRLRQVVEALGVGRFIACRAIANRSEAFLAAIRDGLRVRNKGFQDVLITGRSKTNIPTRVACTYVCIYIDMSGNASVYVFESIADTAV